MRAKPRSRSRADTKLLHVMNLAVCRHGASERWLVSRTFILAGLHEACAVIGQTALGHSFAKPAALLDQQLLRLAKAGGSNKGHGAAHLDPLHVPVETQTGSYSEVVCACSVWLGFPSR